jgi:hypothetical protein
VIYTATRTWVGGTLEVVAALALRRFVPQISNCALRYRLHRLGAEKVAVGHELRIVCGAVCCEAANRYKGRPLHHAFTLEQHVDHVVLARACRWPNEDRFVEVKGCRGAPSAACSTKPRPTYVPAALSVLSCQAGFPVTSCHLDSIRIDRDCGEIVLICGAPHACHSHHNQIEGAMPSNTYWHGVPSGTRPIWTHAYMHILNRDMSNRAIPYGCARLRGVKL